MLLRTSALFGLLLLSACTFLNLGPSQTPYHLVNQEHAVLITLEDGRRMRVKAYGEHMIRIQRVEASEAFFDDQHYQMVENHDWQTALTVTEADHKVALETSRVRVEIDVQTFTASFYDKQKSQPLLSEIEGSKREGQRLSVQFEHDPKEHFSGLGHGYYARADSLDLKGQRIQRNYGRQQIEQAPLIVPFYLTSKGYGVFVNSTFGNEFNFGDQQEYSIALDDEGFGAQLDYFFILGPRLPEVLDHYTQLTGRPRLPAKSMFGLQLSDKGHDHNSTTPSDETWWKQKITEHRNAGYPLDHLVNDNRWRAAGGKRCESKIAWDKERYPDPAGYAEWLDEQGLVITLDFNRCIAQYSEGWQASFNLPQTGTIDFENSAPDLTNADFRSWFWKVFYEQALLPSQGYPGDALWIDEFDEQGTAPKDMLLANGRSSAEMRNYWFFLIAQALVEQGWDSSSINKRPFVWVRGMTAGAQRWATLWSGDIYPNYSDMAGQIRGMQLAGLSGFPFWGHDAGGFYDWDAGVGPDENMYAQWAMAFGSFAPIWKPHGMGQSRWPLDRNGTSQALAHKYSRLRYELMPYLYSAAHVAAETGLPMARPMILDYSEMEEAWQFDLQYMWGDQMLIAPLTADQGEKELWLPQGDWYPYGQSISVNGGQILSTPVQTGELPIFIKQGSIIPKRQFALSTAFIDKTQLDIDLYPGADGKFVLYEDDDRTDAYRQRGEKQLTLMEYSDDKRSLVIYPAQGSYKGAPDHRRYRVTLFTTTTLAQVTLNGEPHPFVQRDNQVVVFTDKYSTEQNVEVRFVPSPAN